MKKRKTGTHHVYKDGWVSHQRVAHFADAPPREQFEALRVLRRRGTMPWEAGFGALAIAYAALFFWFPRFESADRPDWWPFVLSREAVPAEVEVASTWIALSIFPLIFIAFIVAMATFARSRQNAALLLAAYEFELQRRWAAVGWQARRWRRQHSKL